MKNTTRWIAVLALLVMVPAYASDQVPGTPQQKPIALVGGTIHTMAGDVIENGTVIFVDGKITAIGVDIEIPADAEALSVEGKNIYPGLIAANTAMGLVEINAVRSTRDYAETGGVKPNIRAEVSVNPDTELIPVARANGITMALSIPAGGLISGSSALLAMDGWTWEDLTVASPVGMHIRWPAMRINKAAKKSVEDQIKARDERIDKIKAAFANTRAYMAARNANAEKGSAAHGVDLRWEALIPVVEGNVPAFVHAEGIREIQAAVDWANAEGIRMVLVGGADAGRVTKLLRDSNVPVVIGGVHRVPSRRWEDYDTPYKLPLTLHEAGVKFCIATRGGAFNTAHERSLPYHAAMAAAYGLPHDVAMQSITAFAAEVLGVADRMGTIEVGKDATLIVTEGSPLEIMSDVELEFIAGRSVDLNSRHTQLYEKYKQKYQDLAPAPAQSASK